MKKRIRLVVLAAVLVLCVTAAVSAMAEEHTHWANCQDPEHCGECGAEIVISEAELAHDFENRDNGDGTHTQVCDICGAKGKTEIHYITCIANQFACSGCGTEGAYEIWHSEPANAVDNGDGTCTFTCKQCGKTCTEEHYFIDDACDYCGVKKSDVECQHDFNGRNNGDGTHTLVCDICGKIGKTEQHYIPCISDQHSCSSCGIWGDFVIWHPEVVNAVDNSDGSCTFTCTQCGKTCTQKHYYGGGVCYHCGAKDTTPAKSEVVILYGQLGTLTGGEFTPGNGLVEFHDSLFLVDNGRVMTEKNGLALACDEWYYFAAGQAQTQYTGFVQYDGEWFYVTDGKMDTGRNGLYPYDGSKFLLAAGRVLYDYSGLFQNQANILYNADGRWYFIANGQVQTQYTGLAQYDDHWFYLVNGLLAADYTGKVEYDGSLFDVVNGMVCN